MNSIINRGFIFNRLPNGLTWINLNLFSTGCRMHSAESRPEAKHRSRLRGREADELEVGLKKLKKHEN